MGAETPGQAVDDPPTVFARWCRVNTRPGKVDDREVSERWRIESPDRREFWREIAAAPAEAQPDVTVDQLTAALEGKEILVSVGTGAELRKPVRPHDLAVQLLEAVDAQRAAAVLEVAKRAERGPRAIDMEIIERGSKTTDSLAGSVIIPNEVRINGVPVLTSADEPFTVHRIDFPNREAAMVTLTLFVRRLVVAAEGDLNGITIGGAS